MKLLRYILFALLLSPSAAYSQQSVESAVKAVENSKSITSETFSEQRDQSTKELIKSTRVLTFTDNKLADKLIEAIRKDRNKSTEFQMTTGKGKAVYVISFTKNKEKYARYTLIQQRNDSWMLSVMEGRSRSNKRDGSRVDINDVIFDNLYDPDDFAEASLSLDDALDTYEEAMRLRFDVMNDAFEVKKEEFEAQKRNFEIKKREFEAKKQKKSGKKSSHKVIVKHKTSKKKSGKARQTSSASNSNSFYTVSYIRQ